MSEREAEDCRNGGRMNHKLDTEFSVYFYEQEFYVLSNFSAFSLLWKGFKFDTAEAVYHWEKFPNPDESWLREQIRTAMSAHQAFEIGHKWQSIRRLDWESTKVGIMKSILKAKFRQHEYVRRKLMETGNRHLVEDSWRDSFWGWGSDRQGENVLGQLWMEIRQEYLAELPPGVGLGIGQ